MTNKEFPSIHDLASEFDAADLSKTGFLEIDKVKSVLRTIHRMIRKLCTSTVVHAHKSQ